jgi:hypothetical protein
MTNQQIISLVADARDHGIANREIPLVVDFAQDFTLGLMESQYPTNQVIVERWCAMIAVGMGNTSFATECFGIHLIASGVNSPTAYQLASEATDSDDLALATLLDLATDHASMIN